MVVYNKRLDGRKFDEVREMVAKVGVVSRARGSAMFSFGDTRAIAAVYGPRILQKFIQNPERGILRCNYDMMSFSVPERRRPGPSRRSIEISLVSEKALSPCLDLGEYANTVIDVYIEIEQANAGTRCAGITAASMALADAGFKMTDLVSAISVGKIGSKIVVDLSKEEEDLDGVTDIPIAMMPRTNEITLLQLDGNIKKNEFLEALDYARKVCKEINKIQKKALKERYR